MINRSFFGSVFPSRCQICVNFLENFSLQGVFPFVIISLTSFEDLVTVLIWLVQTKTYIKLLIKFHVLFIFRCSTPAKYFSSFAKMSSRKDSNFYQKPLRIMNFFRSLSLSLSMPCHVLKTNAILNKRYGTARNTKLHCLSVMKYKKLRITRDGCKNFCAQEGGRIEYI